VVLQKQTNVLCANGLVVMESAGRPLTLLREAATYEQKTQKAEMVLPFKSDHASGFLVSATCRSGMKCDMERAAHANKRRLPCRLLCCLWSGRYDRLELSVVALCEEREDERVFSHQDIRPSVAVQS
jgi:hypothetical protein